MDTAFVVSFVITVVLLAVSIVFCDKKWSWITWMLAALGLLTMMVAFGLGRTKAQDEPVTTLFTFSCYVTEEGYATVLVNSDGEEHYTLDNPDGIDTDIPSEFTTHSGLYPLGRISTYGEHPVFLVRDDGLGADITPTADWQTWCDKDATPLEEVPTPEPTDVPPEVPQEPTAAPVVSTGRTCVIKYLPNNAVVLVCSQ